MLRCACIDVGSNTTRLLAAEGDGARLRELAAERVFTRLGVGGEAPRAVGEEKIAEVAAVVARQVAQARELGCDALRIVATAAVRQASDRDALRDAIERACGAPLEILSGEEEARLAFRGAVGMLADPPSGSIGVVDVGGGSTELIVGSAGEGVRWSVSLPVGSAVLTDLRLPCDPPTAEQLGLAREHLARVFAALHPPPMPVAYAVGGSATSLRRLVGGALDREALQRGLQSLTGRPAAQIAEPLGLHPQRARLLPAGLLLLEAAARALDAPLRLADGGLREGVVLEQLAAGQL